MNIPLPLNADSYTISSDIFSSEDCRNFSCYNLVNRKSPADAWPEIAKDSRIVFYGINNALRTVFKKITTEDVRKAANFMSSAHSFGGPLYFPREKWEWIVNHNNGYLPIQVSCVPEGTTFFPNEPVLHVCNTVRGFGEFAAHVEARILGTVSIATATATMIRHWLEFCREEVRQDNILLGLKTDIESLDKESRWMIHNFGDRGCVCTEESVIKSKSHLLSFFGSDSFGGAYEAWEEGAKRPTGTSIAALAHRGVLGFQSELQSFQSLSDSTVGDNTRIASFVADCYNFRSAVDSILELARDNPDMIYIIRPDSGGMYETISHIYNKCLQKNIYKEINGFKLPLNVRIIYGDSVKPRTWKETNEKLRKIGCLPSKWFICGIGGYLMTQANRDSLSSAFKLCVKGLNHEPVVKLSETKGKLSIPYMTHLVRDFTQTPITVHRNEDCVMVSSDGTLVRQNYYLDGDMSFETFDRVQARAIKSFDDLNDWATANPTFGLNRENLHNNIVTLQDEFYERFQ